VSGIYGLVRYDGAPVTPETLAPIAAAMSFWGPDGHGQWCGGGVGLGHLMLQVTPESLLERLPASIRVAPHLVITADARIDNRDEIFDALGVPAPGRARTPDSSLILLAYERWGAGCVKRLLGDFAFAIWDARERKLFCARDPFGCMPFVYHYDGKRFIFASDIKGVLARMESPKLNEPLLAAYLQMKTYHAEKRLTFFENIVKLPPAHTLTLTGAGVQLSEYWSPENAPDVRLATDADYAEQMRFLFQQAVECRVRSAFPVGAHLSGGLDSSAISIVAAQILRDRGQAVSVFSWAPPPQPGTAGVEDEHVRIDAVCKQEDLRCQYLPVTKASFVESFRRDITIEPFEMMAWEANVQASAESAGVRTMLSGWGGDEAVSSHAASYIAAYVQDHDWRAFHNEVRRRLNTSGPGLSTFGLSFSKLRRLAGVAYGVIYPHLPDFLYSLTAKESIFLKHRSPCIHPEFAGLYKAELRELRGPAWRSFPGVGTTMCHYLQFGHQQRRLEHWACSGARHRMVYRYPLLDKRLVEFTLGVPAASGQGRSLFRRAISGLLPASCDWMLAKRAPSSLASLRSHYYEAHADWAIQLNNSVVPVSIARMVDMARIQRAVAACAGVDRMQALSGIREAFGCCAIGH
jgi:asparagine synthase (glutamine-hydrolysing)